MISQEEKLCGEYRTKRVILEIYDEMQKAIESGEPYPLRGILAVMKATCEGKGWKVAEQHFDNKSGQYASLEVSRYFNRNGIYDSVIGRLDVTFHQACSDCQTLVCFVYDSGHYMKQSILYHA